MTPKNKRLTPKQRIFKDEYLLDLNASAAARRAGYSKRNAGKIGPELMGKAHVKKAVAIAMKERAKKVRLEADQVLRELMRLGFSDIADFIQWDENGLKLKSSKDLKKRLSRAILEIKETSNDYGKSRTLKLHPKTPALIALARHVGLLMGPIEGDEPDLAPKPIDLSKLSTDELQELKGLLKKAHAK